jgi:hypothetical protein
MRREGAWYKKTCLPGDSVISILKLVKFCLTIMCKTKMCKYVSELSPTCGDSCPNIEIFLP